jgi:hypothetical protein
MSNLWDVSYYVEAERYWQFAGEFSDADKVRERVKFLQANGEKVRVRRLGRG